MNKNKVIIILSSVVLLICLGLLGFNVYERYSAENETERDNDTNTTDDTTTNVELTNYEGTTEYTTSTTVSNGAYTNSDTDTNAILVSGDIEVTLSDSTITKTGSGSGGDNSNFYGTNSAILAKSGAYLTLTNINVTTSADGANGVFSYGGSATTNNSSSDGTTVVISDSTITTTGDNAGGIMTTGGGITYATNLTITTSGTSSAAIRTDRGGGTVEVTGGTYTTNGAGSPTIYSTADITVADATLIATASEGIVIEGKNSVTLTNSTLTDSNTTLNGQSTTYKNIFIYQSMSGDADSGVATFSAVGNTITTNNGDTLYVTNTKATIYLENNTIVNNDSSGNFLRIQKDSWGNSGSNGGDVTLEMSNQEVEGNIVVDSISTLDLTLSDSSVLEGTINGSNTAEEINITLDSSSKLVLTGDSYITSLSNADTTNSNIDFNGYTLYVNGVALN